jgi:hypothetical protein
MVAFMRVLNYLGMKANATPTIGATDQSTPGHCQWRRAEKFKVRRSRIVKRLRFKLKVVCNILFKM